MDCAISITVRRSFAPVFKNKPWDALKFLDVIGNKHGVSRNSVPGNGGIIRANGPVNSGQRTLDFCGCVHCMAIPGQNGIQARAERFNQLYMARRRFLANSAKPDFRIGYR